MVHLGNHVLLKRERTNKYHDRAVKVVQDRKKIGYLPRDLADSLTDEQIDKLNKDHHIDVSYIGYRKKRIDHIDIIVREK